MVLSDRSDLAFLNYVVGSSDEDIEVLVPKKKLFLLIS